MKKILVVADPYGSEQRALVRAAGVAAALEARVDVVGFVYEHLANQPLQLREQKIMGIHREMIRSHKQAIEATLGALPAGKDWRVRVFWEKRVADRISDLAGQGGYDLVIKGGRRSETFLYTPTDWQLLRSCRVPLLLLADRQWRKSRHVMAAVDLGTRVRSKSELNYKVVDAAREMAAALGSELHVGYAVPYSGFLREMGMIEKGQVRREGVRLAREFRDSLAARGTEVEDVHVAVGAPEKALVSLAARNRIGLVVLGTVGRRRLVGRVIGNTAEQILRLLKADILAIKP